MTPDWSAVRTGVSGPGELDVPEYRHLRAVAEGARWTRRRGHFARRDALACTDFLEWFDDADAIRESIAQLIHCGPDDIAFIPNAATALGLLMNGIAWKPGDQMIALEHEFPNNLYWPSLLETSRSRVPGSALAEALRRA